MDNTADELHWFAYVDYYTLLRLLFTQSYKKKFENNNTWDADDWNSYL